MSKGLEAIKRFDLSWFAQGLEFCHDPKHNDVEIDRCLARVYGAGMATIAAGVLSVEEADARTDSLRRAARNRFDVPCIEGRHCENCFYESSPLVEESKCYTCIELSGMNRLWEAKA